MLKQKAIQDIKDGKKVHYITLTSSTKEGTPKKILGIFDILSKIEMRKKGVNMLNINDLKKHFDDQSDDSRSTSLSGEDFMAVDMYKWLLVFIQAHPKDVILVDEFPIIPEKWKEGM